jgi:hypothetical protein
VGSSLRIMLVVISICIIFLCSGFVSALEANEASVSVSGLNKTLFVGDTVVISITFNSNYADQLKIYYIGIHFDWMAEGGFYGNDLSSSPVTVQSQGTYLFDAFSVQIPVNVSAGTHTYYVGVDGAQGSSSQTSFSWDSPASTIQLNPATGKFYNQLKTQVDSKLNAATAANYQNAEAKSLLQQAQTEYNQAISLANEEKWDQALTSLETASVYLDQASTAEQGGGGAQKQGQSLMLYLAIIAAVVIVVVVIVVIMMRKRRRQTSTEAEQTSPAAEPLLKDIEEES